MRRLSQIYMNIMTNQHLIYLDLFSNMNDICDKYTKNIMANTEEYHDKYE